MQEANSFDRRMLWFISEDIRVFGSSKNQRNHYGQRTIKPYGVKSVNFLNQSVTDQTNNLMGSPTNLQAAYYFPPDYMPNFC